MLPVTTGLRARRAAATMSKASVGAADQLDDDLHGRIIDQRTPVGGEKPAGHVTGGGARFGGIADEDAGDVQAHAAAGAAGDEFAVAFEGVPDAGTDGSEAGQADSKGGACKFTARSVPAHAAFSKPEGAEISGFARCC